MKKEILSFFTKEKIILILICCIFFVGYSYLAILKHINLRTALFDFGLEHQVVWNTANLRLFQSGVEVPIYLGDHFSPITSIVALIYKVIPGDFTLLLLQVFAVTICLPVIYRLSQKYIGYKLFSFLLVIVFALYSGVSGVLLFDYHPIVFAFPFLLYAIYYWLVKRNIRLVVLLFVLATFCKEDVGIFVAGFGIFIAIFERNRKALLLTIYGLLISFSTLFLLIPFIRHEPSDTIVRYGFWFTEKGFNWELFKHPRQIFNYLADEYKLVYLFKLFAPFAFIPLLFVPLIILFFPNLLINLISNSTAQNSSDAQYDIMITVGIFLSFIFGLRYVKNLHKISKYFSKFLVVLSVFMIVSNIMILPHSKIVKEYDAVLSHSRLQDYQYIQSLKNRIPNNLIIATSNGIGGQFGDREHLQLFDPRWIVYSVEPDIVIVDKVENNNEEVRNRIKEKLDTTFKLYKETDSFVIIEKKELNL
ncbi:MAG: DUF2079 domain-containing protein [bacterium]